MNNLKEIFEQFDSGAKFVSVRELRSGHINQTFIIHTESSPGFILQRINHNVFPNVPALIRNKVMISEHLRKKLSELSPEELFTRVLTFVPAASGENYVRDKEGNYWNLTVFIEESKNYLKVENERVAQEGGRLFGEFLRLTRDFDSTELFEVIPNFHSMSFRFSQFDAAFGKADPSRIEHAISLIEFANTRREEMHVLENLIKNGELPLRVTHNDTKISNALFSADDEGLCVIDTDTVMPGIIHFDFGDAVRTICNTSDEDERVVEKVGFQMDYFKAFSKGFIGGLGEGLSAREAEYLSESGRNITFIIGLRFLTDYLSNDKYFHIEYDEHNLVRARAQFKLVAEIENALPEMQEYIETLVAG
ncbi:MAG: phosphotransferase enzyme family protein [Pyrinomonadaceae bacterium]